VKVRWSKFGDMRLRERELCSLKTAGMEATSLRRAIPRWKTCANRVEVFRKNHVICTEQMQNNFTFLRFLFALFVVVTHSFPLNSCCVHLNVTTIG
jgi:hypothetical protein